MVFVVWYVGKKLFEAGNVFKHVKYTNNTQENWCWEIRPTSAYTDMWIYCTINGRVCYIFIIKHTYVSVYAIVGHISHNKSSVQVHRSFRTYKKTLDEIIIMSQTQKCFTCFLFTLNKFHCIWRAFQILLQDYSSEWITEKYLNK